MSAEITDIEQSLHRLGEYRRNLGRSALRQVPHPGVDPRLFSVAETLTECAYVDGDFGQDERPEAWLAEQATELAEALQGAYEDLVRQWVEEIGAG